MSDACFQPRQPSPGQGVILKRLLCLLLAVFTVAVAGAQERPTDLTQMSIEDLMRIEVTSAGKKEQKLSQTAAAVYVITQEDIRRSGATSIPEALRLAPGVEVAQINANVWAISIRGFNFRYASKLLVLIDGRSVYSPLFSGVFWDVQDTLLEDVERIEVIRGPGATLWGANAVNGVINIITKRASDTQGGLLTAGGGTYDRGFGGIRYGGTLGAKASYRVFAKYLKRSNLADALGKDAHDSWDMLRSGFRSDWVLSERNSLTLQGDIYHGAELEHFAFVLLSPPFSQTVIDDTHAGGGNLLLRWKHLLAGGSEMALQLYYDRTDHASVSERQIHDVFDLDFQHHIRLLGRHDVVWGGGLRSTHEKTRGSFDVSFDPPNRTLWLFSGFVQDEITLLPDRFRLTLGSKFERNDFTGLEVQPSLRLLWTPHPRHALWAAVSRAVRTPSVGEQSVRLNAAAFPDGGGMPALVAFFGAPRFQSEDLLAYEFGYRVQPRKQFSLDLAAFYNIYHHLASAEPALPFLEISPTPPHLVFPIQLGNRLRGTAYGVEVAASYAPVRFWKLSGSYSWLRSQLRPDAANPSISSLSLPGDNPQHQFQLRSSLSLLRNFEFDTSLFHVTPLTAQGIPDYTRLDARLGWHPAERLELSLGLQNLLDARHPEFPSTLGIQASAQVKRSFYGKVTWRF